LTKATQDNPAPAQQRPILLAPRDLRRLGLSLLGASGAPLSASRVVVEHLLQSDSFGIHSHGFIRMPQYLHEIAEGDLDPRARASVHRLAPARAHVDGMRGFGPVVGRRMAKEGVSLARRVGIAFITGNRMGHTGRIGAYVEAVAESGFIGLATSTGSPAGHYVAPFGGRDGRLATNPIAFAFPVLGSRPVVADFSTAATPEGAMRRMRNLGLDAPDGMLQDASGQPTINPSVLYQVPRGTIRPFGGAYGYRGTALAILVEVLATLLAGDDVNGTDRRGSNLSLIVIHPDSGFEIRAERLGGYVRSSRPTDPLRPVMLPGDREWATAAATLAQPLELDPTTWAALARSARANGIAMPVPLPLSVMGTSASGPF
jgi:LDH2 family malate/lactate/ureidoglycolate dehydrogenase